MPEDAYKIRPGGSLKFKDAAKDKKKKKSKSSTSAKLKDTAATSSGGGNGSSSTGGEGESSSSAAQPIQLEKTDAERRFEDIQKKRLLTKVKSEAKQSHKEKVDKFNTYLESLSEHYDIPKVGPG